MLIKMAFLIGLLLAFFSSVKRPAWVYCVVSSFAFPAAVR